MQKEGIPFVPTCRECQVLVPYEGALHPDQQQCSLRLGGVPHDPVEWVVYSQYAAYPTLFGRSPWSRWFIFDHLFFAIGTGYEWVDGELRDVTENELAVGDAVPWRTLEEEEAEILGKVESKGGRDTARFRKLIEESHQQTRTLLREEWATFEKKPQKWYPLSEYSPIFTLPEHTSTPWLVAACDATQMFLHGRADGQSLQQVYTLIEQRARLFARIGLPVPSFDEARMTSAILSTRENSLSLF